jgi:hypothetical protein
MMPVNGLELKIRFGGLFGLTAEILNPLRKNDLLPSGANWAHCSLLIPEERETTRLQAFFFSALAARFSLRVFVGFFLAAFFWTSPFVIYASPEFVIENDDMPAVPDPRFSIRPAKCPSASSRDVTIFEP